MVISRFTVHAEVNILSFVLHGFSGGHREDDEFMFSKGFERGNISGRMFLECFRMLEDEDGPKVLITSAYWKHEDDLDPEVADEIGCEAIEKMLEPVDKNPDAFQVLDGAGQVMGGG